MRKFTKEITALLATAAVSMSVGTVSATANEAVKTADSAVNLNSDSPTTTSTSTYITTTATEISSTTTTADPYYYEEIYTIGTSIAESTSTTTTTMEDIMPSCVGTTVYTEEIPPYEGTFSMSYPSTETTGTEVILDEEIVAGDANCDGKVSLSDAVLIMQSLANSEKYGVLGTDETHITDRGQKNGDVSESGNGLTNKDALAIQKYMLKIISTLPED